MLSVATMAVFFLIKTPYWEMENAAEDNASFER